MKNKKTKNSQMLTSWIFKKKNPRKKKK